MTNYNHVRGNTAAPRSNPYYALQQPPELVDESDSSPGVASPLTPDWAEQQPDLIRGPIADWDKTSDGDFHIRDVRRFHLSGVPTLASPRPKGLSMVLSSGSIQSALSQHRPPPSDASHSGTTTNFSNLGSGRNFYYHHPGSSHLGGSNSSQSQDTYRASSDRDSLPSLVYSFAMADDDNSSVNTSIGDAQLGHLPRLEEDEGVLVDNRDMQPLIPPRPMLQCAFWFLDCAETFHAIPEWKTHCLSHFKRNQPPKSATCPLCPLTFSGQDAWDERMDHVVEVHHNHGYGLEGSRPDFNLFKWLWKKRIIDDATLKDLEGNFDNMRDEGLSTVTEGRAREARREPRVNRRSE